MDVYIAWGVAVGAIVAVVVLLGIMWACAFWMRRQLLSGNALFLYGLSVKAIVGVGDEQVKDEPGYIYVIQSGSRFKIGLATNPIDRFKNLQTANPEPLKIIHVIETNAMHVAETYLHARFENKRVRGEWFNLSVPDCQWLKSMRRIEVEAQPGFVQRQRKSKYEALANEFVTPPAVEVPVTASLAVDAQS